MSNDADTPTDVAAPAPDPASDPATTPEDTTSIINSLETDVLVLQKLASGIKASKLDEVLKGVTSSNEVTKPVVTVPGAGLAAGTGNSARDRIIVYVFDTLTVKQRASILRKLAITNDDKITNVKVMGTKLEYTAAAKKERVQRYMTITVVGVILLVVLSFVGIFSYEALSHGSLNNISVFDGLFTTLTEVLKTILSAKTN